jgi:MFS family permease
MPFLAALGFLLIAFIFFSLASIVSRRKKKEVLIKYEPTNVWIELKTWKKIGHYLLPVLFFTLYLNIINAFYWVIGPLLSERLNMDGENGLFLMAYLFPPLIVGWIVGRITNRLGKKHTAFLALILGSAVMTSFVVISNPLVLVAVNFVAAFFIAMAWPSINGVYADYISERPDLDTEIETVQDTFTNLGYVIGPVFAGFAAQYLGYTQSFALAGVIGVVVGIALLVITPKHIRIR